VSEKPLQEPAFLVMTALADRPLHGYALVEDVQRVSAGRVKLHTGTLYAILDRLTDGGLVEVDHEEIVDSRLRRYYRLSTAGAERLAAETTRLEQNANAARVRLTRLAERSGAGWGSLRPETGAV